jgi:hypothetical protein
MGRQMARTIKVEWHGIELHLTANKLINKNGSERIVYQAATYKAKPAEHVRAYKIRWTIEKLFRMFTLVAPSNRRSLIHLFSVL